MIEKEIRPHGSDPSFSLYEFEKWLKISDDDVEGMFRLPANKIKERTDTKVSPRLGIDRLIEKINEYNKLENTKEIANEFKTNGGTMVRTEDLDAIIEIGSTEFKLPKVYIKRS